MIAGVLNIANGWIEASCQEARWCRGTTTRLVCGIKTTENALLSASAPEPEASDKDQDPFGYAVNVFSEEVVKRFDYEERERGRLERDIAYLKGQLDAVLTVLGNSSKRKELKSADVVDLPAGFIRKRNDNAA
jgi:hypothetical protein